MKRGDRLRECYPALNTLKLNLLGGGSIHRNRWQLSAGFGGSFAPEYAQDIQAVVQHLLEWLHDDKQTGLRRAFMVWFNRVLIPRKMPDTDFTEFTDLQEVQTMLAETVKGWANEAHKAGLQEGRQEGELNGIEKGLQQGLEQGRQQEAAKLFLLLVDSKFGSVSQELVTKIQQASPEEIEKWTKQIFQAETPEALLNS
jgi:hypothetical protein